jgi:hypothetical protein
MIFAWTKQFLLASGLFALVVTGQTMNLVLKEKRMAQEQLDSAQRSVRVATTTYFQIN